MSCGDVGTLRPYRVEVRGGQTTLVFDNGSSPFTVTLGTDGSLGGSGTVRVDGRKLTGKGPNGEFTYTPRSASCQLEKLTPVTRRGS